MVPPNLYLILWKYQWCLFQHNTCLEALDLEDNGLDGDGLVPVINVFKNNIYITSLVIILSIFLLPYLC